MPRSVVLLPCLLALMLGCGPASSDLPTASGGCGEQPWAQPMVEGAPIISLELALTPQQRARGLMARESMPPDHGMLFVFPTETNGGFWMRNTPLPLSIAYIARDGTVVDLQDMQPFDERAHLPAQPYRYALEVHQGWFAQHGVKVGDVLAFCPSPADLKAS